MTDDDATEGTALFVVRGVGGGYTKAPVLRDIDFAMDANEVVGLFGVNGAGKTTLLRGLSGTLPVFRGKVRLAGQQLERLKPWARTTVGLAHVPEGRHVFANMSVQDNLRAASFASRGSVPSDQVYELFPRLAERSRQSAGSLSGGEQQMLAIGRALMTNPRVLMIDEMSAGLAPVLVEQLVEALASFRQTGTSILLVEQSPHFVADLVDRVILLDQGSIIGTGTMAELGGADRLAEIYLGIRDTDGAHRKAQN